MPRQKQPPSLQKACIQCIADNYSYWSNEQLAADPDFISPFQFLRDDMVQDLIDILHGAIFRRDQGLLFHHNLRRLCIRGCMIDRFQFKTTTVRDWQISNTSVRILSIRCQRLTHLDLQGQRVDTDVLCKLVSSLPRLVSLQLADTLTDRTVLKAIADNCPDLTDLNVENCIFLNDTDFLLLCESGPQLKKINLSQPMISVDTVVSLLKSHPKLQSLGECEYILEAIYQMYSGKYTQKKEIPKRWIHNLSDGTSDGCFTRELDAELVTRCCPYITKLTLYLPDGIIPLSFINALPNLTYLKALHCIGIQENKTVTFKDIVPMLDNIGEHLTTLSLVGIEEVSVLRIGEKCPNLQCLDITMPFNGSNPSYTHTTVTQSFRQLRVLRIYIIIKAFGDAIPAEELSMILENATEITDIRFHYLENLTDSMISAASMKHRFRFLTHVELSKCSNITKETVMMLLSPDNPIETLIFDSWEDLYWKDEVRLRLYAHRRRFKVALLCRNS